MFFAEETGFYDLSDKETHILRKYGVCNINRKPYQVFCNECKKLICNTCYFNEHKGHTVVESDNNPCEIFETIKSETENLSKQRIHSLKGKVDKLESLLMKLNKIKEINGCFDELSKVFLGWAQKNETNYAKNLKI